MEPCNEVNHMIASSIFLGFRPDLAKLLQYFYYNRSYWNFATTTVSDTEAEAFVENAKDYNKKLFAEKDEQTIFNEDMKALKSKSIEESYNFRTRCFKIRSKDSGAFIMRLDYYYVKESKRLFAMCTTLGPDAKDNMQAVYNLTDEMKLENYYVFAKNYRHWFDSDV